MQISKQLQTSKSSLNIIIKFLETVTLSEMTYNKTNVAIGELI